jgi:hypothetical protein
VIRISRRKSRRRRRVRRHLLDVDVKIKRYTAHPCRFYRTIANGHSRQSSTKITINGSEIITTSYRPAFRRHGRPAHPPAHRSNLPVSDNFTSVAARSRERVVMQWLTSLSTCQGPNHGLCKCSASCSGLKKRDIGHDATGLPPCRIPRPSIFVAGPVLDLISDSRRTSLVLQEQPETMPTRRETATAPATALT